jgi:tRNA (cmo5U34)-methyltransferase
MDQLKTAFDALASRFDDQRKYIIPSMDEFYQAAAWAAMHDSKTPTVLDIGAGTGLLAALVLERYPEASVTLLDVSGGMLAVARQRFAGNGNITYVTADYSTSGLPGTYDMVISALSIHHLPHDEKKALYGRVFAALKPGGVFVNADQVLAESPWLEEQYRQYWDAFLAKGALPDEELELIRNRRDTFDLNWHLDGQLSWLRECGFSDVDVIYKNRMFVVFMGRKAS